MPKSIFERLVSPSQTTVLSSILLSAVLLTILMGVLTGIGGYFFTQNYSYFHDPVTYQLNNVSLYQRLATESRMSVAWDEWLHNYLDPIRTIPLVLFAPQALAHPLGHMATVLPVLGLFLALLGWTIYHRTGHLLYSLACMALFCSISGMFDAFRGLAAYWLDLPSALLAGSALLCLLNSQKATRLGWLGGFAAMAGGAVLGRYVSAVYIFIMCSPLLFFYLILRWRQERSFIRAVLTPLAVIGAVLFSIAGYFLIAHYPVIRDYYFGYVAYDYAFILPFWVSLHDVLEAFVSFIGTPILIILGMLFLANLFLSDFFINSLDRKDKWWKIIEDFWPVFAHLTFLILILRASTYVQLTLYALPPLFLGAAAPLSWHRVESIKKRFSWILTILLVVAAIISGQYYGRLWIWIDRNPSPEAQVKKAFGQKLAQELNKQGDQLVWVAYFDDYSYIASAEAFYTYHKLPLPGGLEFFVTKAEYPTSDFPGLNPTQVAEQIYQNTLQYVDVAVVFADPRTAELRFDNDYSRTIARLVAEKLAANSDWKLVFTIDSANYGPLNGYRNLKLRENPAYSRILHGERVGLP